MKKETLKKITSSIFAKKNVFVLTNIKSNKQLLFVDNNLKGLPKSIDIDEIEKNISTGKSSLLSNNEWFLKFYNPTKRVIINGAVHITQALAPMCKICGFEVIIIDPRNIFNTSKRFPEYTLINEWPKDYLTKNPLDNQTAVITLTHEPKLDDPILKLALESKCFYIACLGSQKTHLARKKRLMESFGFNEKDLSRLYGPAGLDINAKTPEEIAVSILAQLINIKRKLV